MTPTTPRFNVNGFVADWLVADSREAVEALSLFRKTCGTEEKAVQHLGRALSPVAYRAANAIADVFYANCVLTVLQLADWQDVADMLAAQWTQDDQDRLEAVEAEEAEAVERTLANEAADEAAEVSEFREFWHNA